MSEDETPRRGRSTADETEAYRGAFGAFPYAVRGSDSWTFRAYVVVAAFVGGFTVFLFALSLVGIVASTANMSATVTLVRGFVLVVMLAVVVPTVAPVLLVARRHRLGRAVDPRYDRALAVTGFVFIAALFLGLLVTAPDQVVPNELRALGLLPPALAGILIWVVHRRLGRTEADDENGDSASPD